MEETVLALLKKQEKPERIILDYGKLHITITTVRCSWPCRLRCNGI